MALGSSTVRRASCSPGLLPLVLVIVALVDIAPVPLVLDPDRVTVSDRLLAAGPLMPPARRDAQRARDQRRDPPGEHLLQDAKPERLRPWRRGGGRRPLPLAEALEAARGEPPVPRTMGRRGAAYRLADAFAAPGAATTNAPPEATSRLCGPTTGRASRRKVRRRDACSRRERGSERLTLS
jgi:hypothetical protein